MKVNSISLILVFFLFISCNKKEEISLFWQSENALKYNKEIKLIPTNKIVKYRLPSDISLNSYWRMNFHETEDSTLLYFIDGNANSLLIYKSGESEVLKRVDFETEGPDGLGKSTSNLVSLVSEDTIFFFDRVRFNILGFTNSKCFLRLNWWDLIDSEKLNIHVDERPSIVERMFYLDNSLYFALSQRVYKSLPNTKDSLTFNSCVKINLLDSSVGSFFPIPQFYKKSYWGTRSIVKTTPFFAMNPQGSSLIFGYSADPHLVSYSKNGELLSRRFIGSEFFESIDPISSNSLNYSKEKTWQYDATSPTYSAIYFNNSSNLIFRFALHGMSQDDYVMGNRNMDMSLIISDTSFTKLGEYKFLMKSSEVKYDKYRIYFDNNAIYVGRQDLYNLDDNWMYFEELKIVSNGKQL